MGLSNKREEIVKKMPYIETKFEKSKDGKFLIHRTIITTVRPVAYFEKVLAGEQVDSQVKLDLLEGSAIEA